MPLDNPLRVRVKSTPRPNHVAGPFMCSYYHLPVPTTLSLCAVLLCACFVLRGYMTTKLAKPLRTMHYLRMALRTSQLVHFESVPKFLISMSRAAQYMPRHRSIEFFSRLVPLVNDA